MTDKSKKYVVITYRYGVVISRGQPVDRALADSWVESLNADADLAKGGYWHVAAPDEVAQEAR